MAGFCDDDNRLQHSRNSTENNTIHRVPNRFHAAFEDNERCVIRHRKNTRPFARHRQWIDPFETTIDKNWNPSKNHDTLDLSPYYF